MKPIQANGLGTPGGIVGNTAAPPAVGTGNGSQETIGLEENTRRWDKEWIVYFNSEDPRPFLKPYTSLTLACDVGSMSAQQVYNTSLTKELGPLQIFVPGSYLKGKRVFEAGCGPGFLCKQLGMIASKVVGMDYSKFALDVARLVSPPTCSFYHSSDTEELDKLSNTIDCMAGRHFFIHQNFDNSLKLFNLARRLLRPQGILAADFYNTDPKQKQGIVFPPKSPLSKQYPSCAFSYSMAEINELAMATGFTVKDVWEHRANQRRFVILERGA